MSGRRLHPWLVVFAVYTAVAVVFALQKAAVLSARDLPVPASAILLTFVGIYTWAALTPPILWVSRRHPLGTGRWRRSLTAHLLVLPAVIFVDIGSYVLLETYVFPSFEWGTPPPPFRDRALRLFAWGAIGDLLWYATVVAVAHALAYRDLAGAREVETRRIEGRLSRVRLQVLRMQLQPHFLFNALNAVSALLREEPESARRVLSRLRDLLLRSLESGRRKTVALAEELAVLEDYLEIQRARFPERIAVEWDVEPGVEAARVPPMLLQPLVENAVRHGIAKRVRGGRIEISARRRNGRLELRVRDDGAGLQAGAATLREGIGLTSTRVRLRDLYGSDHRFELEDAPESGLQVFMNLPFRPSPPARRVTGSTAAAPRQSPAGRLRFLPEPSLAWVGIFTGWAMLLIGQSLFILAPIGGELDGAWLGKMLYQTVLWSSFTVLIVKLCERAPLVRPLRRSLGTHLAANAAIFLAGALLFLGMDELTGWAVWQPPAPRSTGEKLLAVASSSFLDYVLRYWLVVGAAHALAYARLLEEDELRATELETRLAHTELQLQTVQLQPRFLVEALDSVSQASERSPVAAERLLARLSDLLRVVLENDERGAISLREELDLLEPYLTLQQARFPGQLRVQRSVEPETLRASLPGLVLQPLVDHAVRQALEGAETGSVEIRAGRRNGTLEIEVRGDGGTESPALAASAAQTLDTTRLKLGRVYGWDHRLRLESCPPGCLRMILEVPYVELAVPPEPVEPPLGIVRPRIGRSAAAGS